MTQTGQEPGLQSRRPGFEPQVGKIPWRREWQPTPVFLPEESHGQRSLMGYSPWDHRVEHNWATNTFTLKAPLLSSLRVPVCKGRAAETNPKGPQQVTHSFYWAPFQSQVIFSRKHLFTWLCWVLVATCGIFGCGMGTLSCGMWDLVPWPGIEFGPALGAWNLSHWTTREVPPSIPEGRFPTLGISNTLSPWVLLSWTNCLSRITLI